MRVLMLGWEFPPRISGGLGTACEGLARGLGARGVAVTFVVPHLHGDEQPGSTRLVAADRWQHPAPATTTASAQPELRVLTVASPLTPYTTARQYAGLVAACAPVSAEPPSTSQRSHLAMGGGYGGDLFAEVERYAEVVAELAAGESFDLVHAHDWMTFPAGLAAARAVNRPLVVHVHASEYDRSPDAPDQRIVAIEQTGLREASRVVCVSAYTAGVLRRRYGLPRERLSVVHNAVESSRTPVQHAREPGRAPLVVFLGRITSQKGPGYFLEAAARVLELEPRARFVVCGTGDLLPSMVERTAELGLARRVRFTGFLERAEIERVFAAADVYVMPSVSEPFGIAPLEALASGVPVIVSRQSGVSEVLSGALKVDYWDTDELANKILAVLRRPALRNALFATSSEELAEMRWETRGERLREVYGEVLA